MFDQGYPDPLILHYHILYPCIEERLPDSIDFESFVLKPVVNIFGLEFGPSLLPSRRIVSFLVTNFYILVSI